MRLFALISTCLLFGLPSHAFDHERVSGFWGVSYGYGGTPLTSLVGRDSFNIRAGTGFGGLIGAYYILTPTTPHRFELQTSLGYQYQGDSSDGRGTVDWARVPLELTYFYRNTQEKFRVGYGVIYSIFNRLKGEKENADLTASFKNSWGWSIAIDKILSRGSGVESSGSTIGLKYNRIRYESDRFGSSVDGSVLMVTIGFIGE